jgi:hypothetical protein
MADKQRIFQICSKPYCGHPVLEPGFQRCRKCRNKARLNRDRRKRTREAKTPKALAYKERYRLATARANEKWVKRHPEARARSKAVVKAIRAGRLVRPELCQSCSKKKRLVATGVQMVGDEAVKAAFVCWACFFAIQRGEIPMP